MIPEHFCSLRVLSQPEQMAMRRFLRGLKTGLAVVGTLSIGTGIATGYAINATRTAKQVVLISNVITIALYLK